MARVKTFVNGGSLLPGDLNAMEDDYEFAFGGYKGTLTDASYRLDAVAAGTYILMGSGGDFGAGIASANALAGNGVQYADPTIFASGTRTTYYNLRCNAVTNATAPAVNFTVGLYPVTASAGVAATVSVTLGAVVVGSTTAFNAPGASTLGNGSSGDFAAPAAGNFAIAVLVSGAMAASSSIMVRARWFYRQV
jgi:hypothetical protein